MRIGIESIDGKRWSHKGDNVHARVQLADEVFEARAPFLQRGNVPGYT